MFFGYIISYIFTLKLILKYFKVFDYFPKLFSQRELSWLDDIIPENEKSDTEDDHYENKKLESGWGQVDVIAPGGVISVFRIKNTESNVY